MSSNSYQAFLSTLDPMQMEFLSYLDKLILGISGVNRKMRYRVPFYDYNSWLCYLNPKSTTSIELCFLDGIAMQQHYPILQRYDRKKVTGIMLDVIADIPNKLIVSMIHQAVDLNKK